MKKKIFITMLAVFMLTIFSVTAFAYTLGDVTGEGKITAADARLALRYSARLEDPDEEQFKAADVDNSGKITPADARRILRVAAKVDPPFEGVDIDEYLIEQGVLNVAVANDQAPFAYEENGELKGIDVSVFEKIAQYADLELRLHPMSHEDMINAVNTGKCDVAATISSAPVIKNAHTIKDYYDNDLVLLVHTTSEFNSFDKVVNSSVKVGVLADTIDKYTVENKLGADRVVTYTTCREATKDLRDGKIGAFITKDNYAFNIAMEFGDLEDITDPYFIGERHVIITAKEKTEFADKLALISTNTIFSESINEYNCLEINSSLALSRTSLTIAPGGTACLEITSDSFFFEHPSVFFDDNSFCINVMYTQGKQFMLITTLKNSHSETVRFNIPNEFASCTLDITVDPKAPKNIILDDNTTVPDFGVFTKTDAYSAMIDEQTAVLALTYSAEDLYNNGITDTSMLEGFFNTLEKAGYEYQGYMEADNSLIAMYYNESLDRAFSYVEVYDSYGYIQEIGVGFNLFDLPDV